MGSRYYFWRMIETVWEGAYAVLRWQMSPVNVLNPESLAAFREALETVLTDARCAGIVITSGRREFIAGADVHTIQRLMGIADVEELYRVVWQVQEVFLRLETGGKPVVAAIGGAALGGGYELALACHHRIALNAPHVEIGLPEVQLGLMPGAGGTQRLPRKIGFIPALPLILEGRRLPAQEAHAQGLVDELATTSDELLEKAFTWLSKKPLPQNPWQDPKFQPPGGGIYHPRNAPFLAGAISKAHEKTQGHYPNVLYALSALYEGLQVPFLRGLEIEAMYFVRTLQAPSARAMVRTLFIEKQRLDKLPHRPAGIPPAPTRKVAVLGAGMMGRAIAYVCATAGFDTWVKDQSPDIAQGARTFAEKLLRQRQERGRLSPAEAEATLQRLHIATTYDDLAGADLVIEAVIENRPIKNQVYQDVEPLLAPQAILASNTSTLPITSLAQATARPECFIGLHFFSPAERMPLVEVILGEKTSEQTLAWALDFVRQIGKTPIVVRDSRGFFTSRVFGTYVREGLRMLLEGVPPALIENLGRQSGMPVGPLALADEVSIVLMYQILRQTEADMGRPLPDDPVHHIGRLFVEELKRPGRKGGAGFYEYPANGQPKYLWPDLKKYFPPRPVAQAEYPDLMDRFLYVQVAEAWRTWQEGILFGQADGDVASILGWGFAPYTGGVFHFAEYVGWERFRRRSAELAEKYGERFYVPV
jgi:3-hydroxyacyl-CoA dehydrogenase/enoyl-CoA hydratase/3-hydroxybutyryl-CoA epimerase